MLKFKGEVIGMESIKSSKDGTVYYLVHVAYSKPKCDGFAVATVWLRSLPSLVLHDEVVLVSVSNRFYLDL